MNSVNVELDTTFKYANGSGDQVECSFIELREPTGKVSAICCSIEALVKEKIVQFSKTLDEEIVNQPASEEPLSEEMFDKATASEFYNLCVISGVDMSKLVLHSRELFKQVAFMGGEKKLTIPRMDEMSHSDFKKLIGSYLANFIVR